VRYRQRLTRGVAKPVAFETRPIEHIAADRATSVSAMSVGNEPLTDWDDEAFALALDQALQGSINAPNVRLTQQQLQRLLEAAPPHGTLGNLKTLN
jgi:hypothetical protein